MNLISLMSLEELTSTLSTVGQDGQKFRKEKLCTHYSELQQILLQNKETPISPEIELYPASSMKMHYYSQLIISKNKVVTTGI
jgi:hypothetical protein